MNWDAIGTVTELVGAVAIIVTLFYLAKQTRQSVRITMAQEQRTLIDQFNRYLHATTDTENLDAMRRILASYKSLGPNDQAEALVLLAQWVNHYEQSLYASESGVLPEAVLSAFEARVLGLLRTPGGSEFWQEMREAFGADVRRRIDALLSDPTSALPPATETYKWLQPQ